ncbi:flagellar motor switch protein FliN [Saccharophagus sp. K07]|jgi:flagellar motor switch protein FliN/FliY|uniref:flagellar motor switch protein FliN n=1 Tax=Saccharophagus sp. K07 TaxID=2283636 RepID=UPI001652AEAC|nr:flagellar motor switch protein FliN [Saccharophagus sp. K07]MBC6905085.1 flagellar motor switch protein FliN [Saccharophagus sp. K07]
MNSQISESEFDNLIKDADTDLGMLASEKPPVGTVQLPQQDLSFFGKIPVNVTLEVASTEIPLKDLMEVDANSVIALDKLAGDPLDVKVNGALFAKAEVVVVNGNYGLRIVELSGASLNDLTS